jgi:hypothetical protein
VVAVSFLAPTRELCRQTLDNIQKMGHFTGVQVFLAVKDAPGTLIKLYHNTNLP